MSLVVAGIDVSTQRGPQAWRCGLRRKGDGLRWTMVASRRTRRPVFRRVPRLVLPYQRRRP